MRALFPVVLLASGACALGACDNSGPKGREQSGFVEEAPIARQVEGRVLRGSGSVPGAVVQLEPTPGFPHDENLRDASDPGYVTSTDPGGKYRVVNGPFLYDLSIRKDREVSVFRGVASRFFEPSIGTSAPVRGFTATVAAAANPPPALGNAVAYFVSGPFARGNRGEAGALVVMFDPFDTFVTLNAVEYDAKIGLAAPKRYGHLDIHVTSGGAASAVVKTDAIDPGIAGDLRFYAEPPAGFALSMLELTMHFGVRSTAKVIAQVAAGSPFHLGVALGGYYAVRATATRDGAVSDSGLVGFNPFATIVGLPMPTPVTDATFNGRSGFTAVAKLGIVEHVLVPASAASPALRIVTADLEGAVPDLSRLGLPQPAGAYTWTINAFPTLPRAEGLSGETVRQSVPFATTAPRAIELR